MSRIRSIHPGFFTDEAFVQVSAHARLLLLGLGVEADDKGTFPWKPVTLKMRLFPMDVIDIQELLAELVNADAIRRYKIDGKEYGAIRNFRIHQRPKKPNDINPMPDEYGTYVGLYGDSSEPVGNQYGKTSADGGEGRGEESRGEEDGEEGRMEGRVSRARERASKLPMNFQPILTGKAEETVAGWSPGRLEHELDSFRNYHLAKGSTMKDWQAAFRTWIGNAEKFNGRSRDNGPRGQRGGNGFVDAGLDAISQGGRGGFER